VTVDEIVQEALALPREARARVVEKLIHSLEPRDPEILTQAEWEQAWNKEIERRVRDLDEGRVTAISHDEFKRRVRARVRLTDEQRHSVDPDRGEAPADAGPEAAWAAELDRRGQEIDEGRAQLIPADEVFAELAARFPPRKNT
jgi:putative addiction module component (TIGR02574 family)